MKVFSHILQGHEATLKNAIEHAQHFDFSQCETEERNKGTFQDYKDTFKGIDIYYDIAANYYFFSDAEQ